MVKKKTIHRKKLSKKLSKRLLSEIVSKDLLPYLTDKSAMASSKTGSIEKANASTKIDLDSKVELPAKPSLYPENLNPFQAALSEIRLNEDENIKLNEFLERVIAAKDIEELDKIVNQALDLGIRINAHNEDGYSFSNIAIFKLCEDKFTEDKQANIIKKLALSGAYFDKSYIQGNKNTIEICNKVEKEVEPQIYNRLQKLREIGESAAIEGTVKKVEFDNQTFYMAFSQNSRVNVAKVVSGARDLGLSRGNLSLGGNIVRLGESEVEIKTEKNGKRNYTDISDTSAFTVTFPTTLGELHVRIYQDIKNYNTIQLEVENKDLWNKLQKTGESIGQGCLFGGMSVCKAVASGGFLRSGRFCDQKSCGQKSMETIKPISNFKSRESLSWTERLEDTKPVIHGIS
ncbi:hypothetical protein [Wolbachia endosymbiont of Folsomia candida]|uniref:hypothetical protein n=1 Tax=Wolbachia endosymbiont of Folsomia candida TaxID=169402 RepID=UPI000A88CF58|nr:hypothetical protein [Wolbachia endosymbiont of Folsomia candida]APR97880.1 hypothetical protein ASM33_00875 [Wolbachia endosymbiont of Folsomia candida]